MQGIFPKNSNLYALFLHFMTRQSSYNEDMILSVQALGAVYTACFFLLCLAVVHAFRLAWLGYRSLQKKPEPPKEKAAPKPPEEVYYIVERKKKRAKAEYSEPKRIQFK